MVRVGVAKRVAVRVGITWHSAFGVGVASRNIVSRNYGPRGVARVSVANRVALRVGMTWIRHLGWAWHYGAD